MAAQPEKVNTPPHSEPSKSSSSSSTSSHSTDLFQEDTENENLAIAPFERMLSLTSSVSSTRVDYLDTLGSSRGPAKPDVAERSPTWLVRETARRTTNPHLGLERVSDFASVAAAVVDVDLGDDDDDDESVLLERHLLEEREEELRRRTTETFAVDAISTHYSLMALLHFSVALAFGSCGQVCNNDPRLYRTELSIAMTFPLIALLIYRFVQTMRRHRWIPYVLIGVYTVVYDMFLFSICDLIFGPTPMRRDVTSMSLALSVTFFVYSVFVMSQRMALSQRHVRLFVTALAVGFGVSLAVYLTQGHLPDIVQHAFQSYVPSGDIWLLHLWAGLFGLLTTVLAFILEYSLRRKFYDAERLNTYLRASNSHHEPEMHIGLLSLQALIDVELFFIVIPCRLLQRFLYKRSVHSQSML